MHTEEIKSGETLEKWLETRPEKTRQNEAIAIALRTAARVFPICGRRSRYIERIDASEPLALPLMRCLLTGGVAAVSKSPTLTEAATSASEEAYSVADAVHTSASAAATACGTAATATFAATPTAHAATVSDTAASAADAFGFDNTGVWNDVSSESGWEAIRADAKALAASLKVQNSPLWPGHTPEWFTDAIGAMREDWEGYQPGALDFWILWLEALLNGQKMDKAFLTKVALIPDAVWRDGPHAVASEIAKIEEVLALLRRVRELKAILQEAADETGSAVATREHRAHNHPPELLDATADIRRAAFVLLRALEEAEEELQKPMPSPSALQRMGTVLWEGSKALAVYCGNLTDVALKKAAEEIGSTGTKVAIYSIASLYAAQTQPAQSLGKALIDLAMKLSGGP